MPLECQPYTLIKSTYTVQNDKLYRDGAYYGEVISKNGNTLTVKIQCDNKYLNGQVIEMTVHSSIVLPTI